MLRTIVLATLIAPALAFAADIKVSDAAAELPFVAGRPGVAYATLSNMGKSADTLRKIQIDGVGRTEMHTVMEERGIKRMRPLLTLSIAPGESVRFEMGGKHLMLFDVAPSVKAGDKKVMTLHFDKAGRVLAPITFQKP